MRVRQVVGAMALALPMMAGIAQAQQGGRAGGPPMSRPQMEQRLRAGLWRIAKQRLGFNDEQMNRLTATNQRFDARRRDINQRERAERQALRREVLAGDSANQDRIATAMDQLLKLQHQRLDVMAEEQKELSTFMTPLQRAKYAALQEQVRRRVDALRRERQNRLEPGDALR